MNRADKKRCGKSLEELENAFPKGKDECPPTLTGAHQSSMNCKHHESKENDWSNANETGLGFVSNEKGKGKKKMKTTTLFLIVA